MKVENQIKVLLVTTFSTKAKNNFHIVKGVLEGIKEALADVFLQSSVEYTYIEDAYYKIKAFRPNLTIVFGSAIRDDTDFGTLTTLAKESGSRTVFWVTDDPYEFDARDRFVSYCDLVLTNDFGTQPYYFDDNKVHHLPLAASKSNDYRELKSQRDIEFFFCGFPYENRKNIIQDLRKVIAVSRLTLSRGDWGLDGCNYVDISTHEELISCYARSKYVLNIGRTYNLANGYYNINPTTPGPRTFEAALAGTVQIYLSSSPEISDYYLPDKEILVAENVALIPEIIERNCSDQVSWEGVADAAQKRTVNEHLYKYRIQRLFKIISNSGIYRDLHKAPQL